ncbi:EI24 domain-containing protein [Sphingomonas morindae]|uniref:EI24 domain-containing protein n=1 Tax=Sphingomonas morindae TaxID=1541170 RepID=A0ABY4XA53_9SPHN|nr:EI24 domain-containing protein [Sphingomonas morindae]USI73809.1 EI24 domain-containing protein [Sphingomonas morindae]
MLRALALAVGQLADPALLRILMRSLLLTLALFAAAGLAIGWALSGSDPCGLIGLDGCPLDATASGLSALLATLLGLWLLFPAVAIGVLSGFMDAVVAAVEARHYPAARATARPLGPARALALGLRSSARLLVYNLVALPFYLVLLVTGIGPALLFVLVNGLALGTDLGEMVALRHVRGPALRPALQASRGARTALGVAAAALFLVPFVNLLVPIVAAAAATHLYHGRREGRG